MAFNMTPVASNESAPQIPQAQAPEAPRRALSPMLGALPLKASTPIISTRNYAD
jgi:hypothetical protein